MKNMKVISPCYIRTEKKSSAFGCRYSNINGGCQYSNINGGCRYSNINGSDPADVIAFQMWANINKSAGLDIDGLYGPKSKSAYNLYGAEWEASKLQSKPKEEASKSSEQQVMQTTNATPKRGSIAEKWKALSTTKKALVIGGGMVVTTGIFVLIWKLIPKK